MQKLSELLQARKFWALVVSLTAIWTAVYVGSLPVVDAINASVAALAAFSIGTGIEGAARG
jgi:hypothetical protein